MKVLIVDDEPLARERLKRLISETLDQAKYSEAGNGIAAVEQAQLNPDLIFLDVEMPGLNGLESAQQISQNQSHIPIIFTTAYDNYALDAFNVLAAGFLVKPVNREKLRQLLEKLKPTLQNNQLEQTNLVSKVGNVIEKMAIADVEYVIAENKYTHAYSSERSLILDATLKQLEQDYPHKFIRVHRNTLVDKHLVEKLSKQGTQPMVHLKGVAKCFEVSRRHLKEVKQLLHI